MTIQLTVKPVLMLLMEMMTNSKAVTFFLPVNPVPASRPRVSKWGVFYGKCYTAWRKQAAQSLTLFEHDDTFTCPVSVTLVHALRKAKASKRTYPRGDVDNYDKAVLDAITSHTSVWEDDDQVIQLHSSKVYISDSETAGCYIRIEPLDTLPLITKLRKLFASLWR